MRGSARDYNVLFIISDQHRRRAAGCYGNSIVQTPKLRDSMSASTKVGRNPTTG